jgi:hypothetical protein
MKTITHRAKLAPPLRSLVATLLLAIVCPFSGAAQNDFFPTDYVALPAGTTNIAVYAVQQTLNGPWQDGARRAFAADAKTHLLALRVSRLFAVGEQDQYTIAPVMVLSTADSQASTPLSSFVGKTASGLGDLRLGTAFWFHADRVNRNYALASLFVVLPTGDYSSAQTLNIGENRVKTILSMGWMQTLNQRWVLELAPEVAFFGDNPDYRYLNATKRLSQDIAYAATGSLRYKFTPSFHVYASAQLNRGGATQLDGDTYTGAPNNTRAMVGALLLTADNSQLQLRYAQDTQWSNGFRNEGEFALRWSVFFR